jgi:UBX domain-containing protein 7
MADNDELVSQFLAFTGSADTDRAISYLEMSGGNLETAVGLYMEHHGGGIGGAGGGGAAGEDGGLGPGLGSPEVRAPDATRTMRLMDDGGHGHHDYMQHQMDAMMEDRILQASAFGAPRFLSEARDARELVNSAASAAAVGNSASSAAAESKENYMDDADDDDSSIPRAPSSGNGNSNLARLADMFAPPDHLIFKEGGFEGARNMAKDNKRWLLVNLQRDSEFSCHALNRDVWRDELVENLIREGFIFWQAVRRKRSILFL